jgi:site-specific DNA-cytosine methylase
MTQIEIIDAFSGLGLFSSPAISHPDEFRLAFAIDEDRLVVQDTLKTKVLHALKQAHPHAEVVAGTLPAMAVRIPLPSQCTHMHLSPPCVGISSARRDDDPEAKSKSIFLLAWSFEYVLATMPPTFSIEDVPAEEATSLAESYKKRYPQLIDYAALDADAFGTPQTRRRLIVSTPEIISVLRSLAANPHKQSVAQAFHAAGLPLPATHIKASTELGTSRVRACVSEGCYTVVASRAPIWCDEAGKSVRAATPQEVRVLMGAPVGLILPGSKAVAQRALGNGVAYGISLAILKAAAASTTRASWVQPQHGESVEELCRRIEARARQAVAHATRRRLERSKATKRAAELGRGFSKRQRAEAVDRLIERLERDG